MNNLNFGTPWMLALLWLVPLAAFGLALLRVRHKRRGEAWVSPVMQAKLLPKTGAWRFAVQLSLLGAGFLCAFLALARPHWGEVQEIVTRQGRDLMIVLDVSRSMLATDVMPNRLERAKADLIDLVTTLGGDRAGLILFRHKAVQVCPLTTDYAFLLQMLDGASPDSAPPGETDIGDSIFKALDALDIQQSAHQAIVLISDGEDLAEKIQEAIEKAKTRGVTIFTVGFGSLTGSSIPDPAGGRISYKGEEVNSKLNPTTLRTLATRTGGVYVPVGTARADLGDLYRNHLRKLAARELDESITRRQVERFAWFLIPAILFWLIAAAFSPGRPLLRAARRKGVSATVAILVFLFLTVTGQASETGGKEIVDPQQLARSAQTLYRQGKYAESAEAYKKAADRQESRSAARNLYNAGCALYAAGRYPEAVEAFRAGEAARINPAIPSRYNQGCALLQDADANENWKTNAAAAKARADLIESAAKAFQESLPADIETRTGAALDNLNLAAERAENARRQAREIKLEETYGKMNAGQIAQQLLEAQRRLGPEVAAAFSNNTPSQINQLESAAVTQREAADMMTPLTRKLEEALQQSASGTNAARQAAEMRQYAAALTDLMNQTADRLRDADPMAQDMLPAGERASYTLWKGIAPFDLLLREDIRVESNAVLSTSRFQAHAPPPDEAKALIREQEEAGQLTRLFSERFAQAVPEGGLPAAPPQPGAQGQTGSDSNAPAISAETRAKILQLATNAASMQADAVKAGNDKDWTAAHTLATNSYAILKEIESLLPKQNQSSSSQDQKQDQKQDQQQQKQDEKKQEQQKQDPQQNQESKPEQKPEKPPEAQEQKKEEMSEEKARALLEKARLREKEYLDEKQKRAFFDRATSDRDW